ncbi:hypothetical protein D3C81_847740 [compost metagenome]
MSNAKDNVLPKWLQLGDGIATVALSRASQANGIQVDKLTLREPTVREMRSATLQGGSNEEEQEMVALPPWPCPGRARPTAFRSTN